MKTTQNDSENLIQQQIFTWFNNNFCLKTHEPRCLIAAIPNGANVPVKNRMTLIATGMYSGFADLMVIIKTKTSESKVIFVEVKTPSGVQSNSQIDFMSHIRSLHFPYFVVRDLDSFKMILIQIDGRIQTLKELSGG